MVENPLILSDVEAARTETVARIKAALIDVPRYDMESGNTGASMEYRVNGDWILFDEAMKAVLFLCDHHWIPDDGDNQPEDKIILVCKHCEKTREATDDDEY